jgi:hypothetical protein
LPQAESHNNTPIQEETVLEWTVHLLKRDPSRARAVAGCMLLAFALGALMFRSLPIALLGPLLLFSATAEYLLPIRYRLTTLRATASYGAARLEIPWERVKRCDTSAGMVRLSPFAFPNRLDNFRGVGLRFGNPGEAGDRDSVTRVVEERLAAARSNAPQPAAVPASGAAS